LSIHADLLRSSNAFDEQKLILGEIWNMNRV
jgi:hypothetical protein